MPRSDAQKTISFVNEKEVTNDDLTGKQSTGYTVSADQVDSAELDDAPGAKRRLSSASSSGLIFASFSRNLAAFAARS